MIQKILNKLFPKIIESVRLQGYSKGYSEGYCIGLKDGKIKGYKDGLSRNGVNSVYIDSYGMSFLGKNIVVNNNAEGVIPFHKMSERLQREMIEAMNDDEND